MTRKRLILDLALLFLLWNLTYGEDYILPRIKDRLIKDIKLATGSSAVVTSILNITETIDPYRIQLIWIPNTSHGQLSVHGSPVGLYGYDGFNYSPLLPISALGTDYIVSTCHPPGNFTSLLVIATHSQGTDAVITFRLSETLTFEGRQYSDGSRLTLSLGPFEARTISSSSDLTGTVVSSAHSVAVYCGLDKREFDTHETLIQLLPVKHYGHEYVVANDTYDYFQQLQIVSDHNDTSVVFNNGSTVRIGNSHVYRGSLKRNENLSFKSNTPVMTTVCRVIRDNIGAVVVPPVKLFTQNAAMRASVIKILTEQNTSDIKVNVGVRGKLEPYAGTVDWVEIQETRYKVGTVRNYKNKIVYISSENNYFSTLAYHAWTVFTGGYNFSFKPQATDTRRVAEGICSEDKSHNSMLHIANLSNSQLSACLKDIGKIDTNNTDFPVVIEVVANIIAVIKPNSTDLDEIVTILEGKKVTANITSETVETVLEIASTVLKTPKDIFAQAQHNNNVANRLIKVVDGISDRLITSTEGESKFITDAFVLTIVDLTNNSTPGGLPVGMQVTESSANASVQFIYQSNNSLTTPLTGSAVFFQEAFFQHIMNNNTGRNVRLSMNYHSNPVLFTLSENSSLNRLKSKVISAKILVDGKPLTELYNYNLTLAFHQTKDYYGQVTLQSAFALSVITKVGLTLSIAGLSITMISNVFFRDKRLTADTRPQWTLFNLALAQLCSWVVFLAGVERTENHVGCIVVAALLHYFILASFLWMLAMAVLYYLKFVKILETHTSRYMLKIGIPAWGIPILPVVTLLAVDIELYNGGDMYCWMSLTAFYYAFGAPVGLILLANVVLYIMVVVNICKQRAACKSSQNRPYLQNIKASFFSFIMLGLSWIFGFLAISDARLVFQYIFCVSCSLQGFLIFVFFTLRDQRIRDSWRTCCCRTRDQSMKRKHREKTTTDSSSPSRETEDTKM